MICRNGSFGRRGANVVSLAAHRGKRGVHLRLVSPKGFTPTHVLTLRPENASLNDNELADIFRIINPDGNSAWRYPSWIEGGTYAAVRSKTEGVILLYIPEEAEREMFTQAEGIGDLRTV